MSATIGGMGDLTDQMKNRIRELEVALASKEAELQVIRKRLTDANAKLEVFIDQVATELQIATQIQKKLSPVILPQFPGFEFSSKFIPGMKSGGDYFDIFEHDDKMKFGILVASCSGYSMSALLLTVLIKISSQMEAKKGMSADQVINALGAEMLGQMKEKDKVSLFYGIVDRRNYTLSYASVGKVSVFLQQSGKDSLIEVEPSAAEISIANGVKAQQDVYSLSSKDRLILVTEGVHEVQSPKNETWGIAGVKKAIKDAPKTGVHELRNEILIQAEQFSKKADPDRDQTVLVMEVKDQVIKLAKI